MRSLSSSTPNAKQFSVQPLIYAITCPKGPGLILIHDYCVSNSHNEDEAKYWAACLNQAADVDGNLQLQSIPEAYADDAFRLFAYYAIE